MEPKFSAKEKARCTERELALRKRVYPNRVMTKRMTQREADYQIALMEEIASEYAEMALDAEQLRHHNAA
jgi:hypothetical protein